MPDPPFPEILAGLEEIREDVQKIRDIQIAAVYASLMKNPTQETINRIKDLCGD